MTMERDYKKIIAFILLIGLLVISACGRYDAENIEKKDYGNGYFTTITSWGNFDNEYYIVYANDTKVKYLIWYGTYKGSITPLYNADGSLQVYEEDA